MSPELVVEWLGCVPYAEALVIQEQRAEGRRAGHLPDTLLLLEHPPVVTLGRRARPENLLVQREALAVRGVEVHEVSRGGDITLHAPGQLVGYPILDLAARGEADVHAYLRAIESALIEALAELGVPAQRLAGMTGVYAARATPGDGRPRKLASIGVGVRGWVTRHGFALNVELDLSLFGWIVACGLHGVEMSSVARELGAAAPADLGKRAREAVTAACVRRWGAA